MTERDFQEERERWVKIIDFKVWEILKILESGPKYVREIRESGFVGSYTDLTEMLRALEEMGFVSRDMREHGGGPSRHYISLTEDGRWLLRVFDRIGERIKELRGNSR